MEEQATTVTSRNDSDSPAVTIREIEKSVAKFERLCAAVSVPELKRRYVMQEIREERSEKVKTTLSKKADQLYTKYNNGWLPWVRFVQHHPDLVAYVIRRREFELSSIRKKLRDFAARREQQARWLKLSADSAPFEVIGRVGVDSGKPTESKEYDTGGYDTGALAFRLEGDVLLVNLHRNIYQTTLQELKEELNSYLPHHIETLELRPLDPSYLGEWVYRPTLE